MELFEWASLLLDISPLGDLKSVFELFSGKDLITQEDLNIFDRATCAISIIPIAGWIAKVQKVSKSVRPIASCEKFLKIINLANKANNAIDKFNYIREAYDMATPNHCGFDIDPGIKNHNIFSELLEKYDNPSLKCYKLFKDNPVLAKVIVDIFMKYHQNNNRKSVEELATEVIRGDWGVGQDRKNRLESAGYNYQEVQDEVNRRYRKK
jgi:hypothetical protein